MPPLMLRLMRFLSAQVDNASSGECAACNRKNLPPGIGDEGVGIDLRLCPLCLLHWHEPCQEKFLDKLSNEGADIDDDDDERMGSTATYPI